MGKLLLLSIILGTIAVPARISREKNPQLALKKTIKSLALLNFFYLLALQFIWHRL